MKCPSNSCNYHIPSPASEMENSPSQLYTSPFGDFEFRVHSLPSRSASHPTRLALRQFLKRIGDERRELSNSLFIQFSESHSFCRSWVIIISRVAQSGRSGRYCSLSHRPYLLSSLDSGSLQIVVWHNRPVALDHLCREWARNLDSADEPTRNWLLRNGCSFRNRCCV